ncbi:MAG TPA: ABC transporter substrate-binding protein [Candidatus Eisenbacteria bacterium]|nr:ABC transporter substrate-binding protein [Candidatus Eisenbacteria bacterium]
MDARKVTKRVGAALVCVLSFAFTQAPARSADKLYVMYSARVMSQAYPWIAQEAGLYKKYDLEIPLVFVTPGAPAVATILSGDSEVTVQGAAALSRAIVQGNKDIVFIGGIKSILTHSFVGRPEIKSPEDLRGKKIGVSRIGSNPHYFALQALRRFQIDARDVSFIQTGGAPETLAALVAQGIDVAILTVPTDAQALKLGYRYVIYGPDLRIAYAATTFNTRRSIIAKRGAVVGRFMRAMAEAAKIMHTDPEFTYRVLEKYLRIDDRKLLEASYHVEIKALEPKLALKPEAFQSALDEIAPVDPRAKNVKPQEMLDTRYLDEMERSGFFDQLWRKR